MEDARKKVTTLDAAFNSVPFTLVAFLGMLRASHITNTVLFDISFREEAAPQQHSCSKNLRLINLNNLQALKMWHFSQSQLSHLCAHFGLAALAVGVGTTIPIFTGLRTIAQFSATLGHFLMTPS